MEDHIFETSHPTSSETVLIYYEHMLCAVKQRLGVAGAAERLTCRRQCRAKWKVWMKRQITAQTSRNKKCEPWKKMGGTAIRLWTWPRNLYLNWKKLDFFLYSDGGEKLIGYRWREELESLLCLQLSWLLFGLLLNPEDEGSIFLRNTGGLTLDYRALHPIQ
jgi:hypothetical protein